MPFTLAELVTLSRCLRDACLGIIKLAYPETKTEHREEYMAAFRSVGVKTNTEVQQRIQAEQKRWVQLFKVSQIQLPAHNSWPFHSYLSNNWCLVFLSDMQLNSIWNLMQCLVCSHSHFPTVLKLSVGDKVGVVRRLHCHCVCQTYSHALLTQTHTQAWVHRRLFYFFLRKKMKTQILKQHKYHIGHTILVHSICHSFFYLAQDVLAIDIFI